MPRSTATRTEHYSQLSRLDALAQLRRILDRSIPPPGARQEPFLPVETLLCYGLFFVFDPHRFGGANIMRMPPTAATVARFLRRTRGSVLSKMLNLDGSRVN